MRKTKKKLLVLLKLKFNFMVHPIFKNELFKKNSQPKSKAIQLYNFKTLIRDKNINESPGCNPGP